MLEVSYGIDEVVEIEVNGKPQPNSPWTNVFMNDDDGNDVDNITT